MSGRSFLFLQGPPGPFFRQVAHGLRSAGNACCRININGGDAFDWRQPALHFTGSLETWATYLDDVLIREQISDIVLFGDCRAYHAIARAQAATAGIAVHVFEEGYIRPDWVTYERGGVNGHSSLPRDPASYRALGAMLPAVPIHPSIEPSFRQRASEAAGYFLACLLLGWRYPHYRSHRPYPILVELQGWSRRLLARTVARRRSAKALRMLGNRRFFLLPLQLDSDHQLRIHSPFAGMRAALAAIVTSFAANAPLEATLLVKEHPLDNGLHCWRDTVRSLARDAGVEDRVFFIEHGDLYTIIEAAAGVVTVNSTTGTLALLAGIPVSVLGTAVYDVPGMTDQAPLDRFWAAPAGPDAALYDAFRRVLVARCLLRGGFSSRAARAVLVPAAVERLLLDDTADIYGREPERAAG